MKSFQTSILIHSTPEKIWKLLTDAPNYPTWNTTFDKLDGKIALGEKLALYVKLTPGKAFKTKVVEFIPNQKMVWADGMPLGLFKAARTYTLTPKGDGNVEFSMVEIFSGLMSPLITKAIPDMQPSFDEYAACLKREAEKNS
jgi:hypothetical protein